MASSNIEQLLGYVTLSEMVEVIANGVYDPLPPAFEPKGEEVIGDATRYIQVTGTRAVPRLVQYGAPPIRRHLRPIMAQDVKLLSVSEEQPIDPMTMSRLRSPNTYERDIGFKEVEANVERFATLFGNFRKTIKLLILANGRLGFDVGANLLPDSGYSGAAEQVTFQIPANNQNQLNGIIALPWSLNSTDIPLQIRNLRLQARQDTGYKLKYALYGMNVPSYITQNDYCVDYLSRNPRMNEEFMRTGEIPDGFMDLTWVPMYEAFWDTNEDTSPTAPTHQTIWGNDLVVFTPDPAEQGLKKWWAKAEGSTVVPTGLTIATDAMRMLDQTAIKYGMFGYGTLNPYQTGVSIKTIMGDVVMYYLKSQYAIYQATVKF